MSDLFSGLASWACVPYSMALLVVVFSLVFQLVGLVPWGSHGAEADGGGGGHDADAAGHAADAGHGAHDAAHVGHAAHDGHAGHDAESGHDADADEGFHLLAFIGVGKVPLAVVLQTAFTMFGLVGIVATAIASSIAGHLGRGLLPFTLPAAILLGLMLAAATVRTVARLVPATSGRASARRDLVGCSGVVISRAVAADFGEVRLQDPAGRTIRLLCYTHAGDESIPEGSEVVVTDWDREHDRLYVTTVARMLQGRKQG